MKKNTPSLSLDGIRRIGELSNDGVFIYNFAEHRFDYFNKRIPEIFVQKGEAVLTTSRLIMQFIKAEDTHYLQSRFNELLEKGALTSTEFRLEFPDGGIRHICCDAYVMEGGTLIVGFVKDFTKTKQHEDFIINYGARKDTLLDMITHNLSGPLHISKQLLDQVQKTVNASNVADISAPLSIISDSTLECINIVNDFLREEHQESAHTYVRKTRFDIIERINTTLEKLKELNKDKEFRLATHLHNLNITADSVKFFQVIHNLLSNAIKFTSENGRIDVNVEEAEKSFTISVTDTGIGIPRHLHALIFQPRTPAGRSGLKGERSSGLGLSIVKQLVDIMGGKIWFESDENKGATFFVRLPKG